MSRPVLTDAEHAVLRLLLARAAGLVFDDARKDSMAYSVADRLRATGVATVAAYLDLVTGPDSTELAALINEVTIQETHFFRNPPQVRALRQTILPELFRSARAAGRRRLRVWSAGCSTGEEPYTVAMLLHEMVTEMPDAAEWDVRVLATDVSSRALAMADQATYGARAVQMVEPADLARFFEVGPDRVYAVRPEVRALVELRHHNLVTDAPPYAPGEVDLVLCRNVTIYFGRSTTRALVERIHGVLTDGGYLLLGHSETLWQVSDAYRLVALGHGDSAAFVYRRVPEVPTDRRLVLPERRSAQDGPPVLGPERRAVARRRTRPADRRRAPREVHPEGPLVAVRTALAQGRYAEADRLAAEVLLDEPLLAEAHHLRGVALGDLGRDTDALVCLRKAVYLAPGDGFAHFRLAGALARTGDRAAACREYAAAAETLGTREQDARAAELGGRTVQELVELCRLLARQDLS